MDPFTKVEDGLVITFERGIYRQTALYERGGRLYTQRGSGYVKLYKNGHTGLPKLIWKDIDPGFLSFVEEPLGLRIVSPKSSIKAAE